MDTLAHIPESLYGFLYHYYRAEVYRETVWRSRMDVTTNWAIGATGAILSFVFSTPGTPHSLILLNFLIVLFFLYIESRRFRYYEILKKRTRLIERHVLTDIFTARQKTKEAAWAEELRESLERPVVPMSRRESIAWRLRRNYIFILPIVIIAWFTKITMSPVRAASIFDVFRNATLWVIPGAIVFAAFIVINVFLILIAARLPQTSEEDDLP